MSVAFGNFLVSMRKNWGWRETLKSTEGTTGDACKAIKGREKKACGGDDYEEYDGNSFKRGLIEFGEKADHGYIASKKAFWSD